MSSRPYLSIVAHYEKCLRDFGEGPRAVDWRSADDAALRYEVMLGLVREPKAGASLLDFGCGLGAFKAYMQQTGYASVRYTGLEISPEFARAARERDPSMAVLCMDVLAEGSDLPDFDYIVMNGIFTRRHDASVEEMDRYLRALLTIVYASCRKGLAFNVMSKAVDWESDVLFHPEPGALLAFVASNLTRNFVLRNDYGLHETTCYLYREPAVRRVPELGTLG